MLLNVDQVQTGAALCTSQTLVCIWSGVLAARYHTNRNIFRLSRFALCVCASRLGHDMVCASRNNMIWILGDCRCQSLEASFLPELLGRTKTDWNLPHSRSTACCCAEDISSRAGLSSRASTKTYDRVHTRCAEINELSGRNYGVWSLLLQLLEVHLLIFSLPEAWTKPRWKKWWSRGFGQCPAILGATRLVDERINLCILMSTGNSFKMVQVWLTHLFRLVDIHTLQPLSDIPSHGWTQKFVVLQK